MITALDHVNIRTTDLSGMTAWYARVLGLVEGPRPGFAFPGAWLYAGEHAIVHLVGVDTKPGAAGTELRLEHFALRARGRAAFLARLDAARIAYQTREIADFGIMQVNVHDPDGNHIHVDFALDDDG